MDISSLASTGVFNADFLDEYLQMCERSSRLSLDHICSSVMEIFGPEYLRKPTVTDVEKLYQHHEESTVVLTMAFSVDGDINQKKSEASGLWLSRVPRNTTNTSSSKSRSKGKSIIKVKKETDNVDCEILWEDLITKEQIGQGIIERKI
ncbi:hypothetical protein Tco_1229661 [Tanacetum coccineum]